MTSPGYQVNTDQLRSFAARLEGHLPGVAGVQDKVSQADVGANSWGVVGLFLKERYTDMVRDLNDLLESLETGLGSASEKVRNAASIYDQTEDDYAVGCDALARDLGGK